MQRYSLMFIAFLSLVGHARAQSWADGMFDELTRDFGSVPIGQVLTHPFRIVNNSKKPVHIASVTVSCGKCSSARALRTYLQPGEETAILGTMDTNRFIGAKTITVTVVFDQPHFEQVRLWMQANSRQDVAFSPDNISFGRIKRGTTPAQKITITFPGSPQTEITEIKSESNYVTPVLKNVQRNGETAYVITAKLRADTPAGKWYTDLWLKTNNASMPRLRVPVTVEVESPLSVNPSTVSLGEVKAGAESDRKVIIRGVRPFRITGIFGTDKQLQVRTNKDDSMAVHVLTVTLNPNEPGELLRKIRVQTDLTANSDIEFHAHAKVVP